MATVTIDSFIETASVAASSKLYGGWWLRAGQVFTAYPTTWSSCKFYLKRYGSTTGSAYAALYNITGTYGTSGKPTGDVLATSATKDIATLNSTDYALETFTFASKKEMGFGQYAVSLFIPGATTDATTYVLFAKNKVPAPANKCHPGNSFVYSTIVDWAYQTGGNDVVFYAYGSDVGRYDPSQMSYNIVHQARPRSVADITRDADPMIKASAQAMRIAAMERERIARMDAIRNQKKIKELKKSSSPLGAKTIIPVDRETSRKPNLPRPDKSGHWRDNIGTNIRLK